MVSVTFFRIEVHGRDWLPTSCIVTPALRTSGLGRFIELGAFALSLNTRPRARLKFESPLVAYTQHIALLQAATDTVH